jgi:ketosteroid isomerase-like protein
MRRKLRMVVLGLTIIVAFGWRAQSQQPSDAKVLLKVEADFEKATAEHGLDGYMSYYAEDSAELSNGSPIISGKANIRRMLEPWGPENSLIWTPVRADIAASGDLGYTYGNFVLQTKESNGKLVSYYGKYATVWKKQKDGTWKVAFDMGNSSPQPK